MPLSVKLTPDQLKIGGAVLLLLLVLYYVVVKRPSLAWSFYVLGKNKYGPTFGAADDYIRAWAGGVQAKKQTFSYAGKVYQTSSGTVLKA